MIERAVIAVTGNQHWAEAQELEWSLGSFIPISRHMARKGEELAL